MRGKIIYAASLVLIALPWLFLFELWPISYSRMGTLTEVLLEGTMFVLLMVCMVFLKKELKRLKTASAEEGSNGGMRFYRISGTILYILENITLVILGLVLMLIVVSFTLL